MVAKKGKKVSQTSTRPVLKTKKPHKKKVLTKDDVSLQKKISKEGLVKKAPVPGGNIALKKDEEIAFKEKTKLEKKKFKKGQKPYLRGDVPGIICLTNLPHGFFEKQLMKYFSQFGEVRNVRLVRSKQSGRSCGYGYVEFAHSIVARIAAETMDNYLTYGKIMKCRFLSYTKAKSEKIFGVQRFKEKNCPKVVSRSNAILKLNGQRTKAQVQKRTKRVVSSLSSKLNALASLGVKLDLDVDIGNLKIAPNTRSKTRAKAVASDKKEETEKGKAEAVASDKKEENVKKAEKGKAEAVTSDKKEENVKKATKVKKTKKGKAAAVASDKKEEIVEKVRKVKKTKKKKVKVVTSDKKEEIVKKVRKVKKTKKKKVKVVASDKESVPSKEKGNVPSDDQEITPSEEKEGSVPSEEKEASVPLDNQKSIPSEERKGNVPTNTIEESVVFEADESDDEIVVKTPPFAFKKLVKITTSSPASRLVGSAKSELDKKTPTKRKILAVTAVENTPKLVKNTTPGKNKTPKASKVQTKQQQGSVKRNNAKKRRMSVIGAEENIREPNQKRRSL